MLLSLGLRGYFWKLWRLILVACAQSQGQQGAAYDKLKACDMVLCLQWGCEARLPAGLGTSLEEKLQWHGFVHQDHPTNLMNFLNPTSNLPCR